jgi:hypothetical protein
MTRRRLVHLSSSKFTIFTQSVLCKWTCCNNMMKFNVTIAFTSPPFPKNRLKETENGRGIRNMNPTKGGERLLALKHHTSCIDWPETCTKMCQKATQTNADRSSVQGVEMLHLFASPHLTHCVGLRHTSIFCACFRATILPMTTCGTGLFRHLNCATKSCADLMISGLESFVIHRDSCNRHKSFTDSYMICNIHTSLSTNTNLMSSSDLN